MNTNSYNKKEQIWLALFGVTPMVLLINLKEYFASTSMTQTLYAGIFGALGVGIGLLFYQFVKSKNTVAKVIALTFLTAICISTIAITSYMAKPRLARFAVI